MRTNRTQNAVNGYKKGLAVAEAKPVAGYLGIIASIDKLSTEHGRAISAGGNAEKLNEIAQEKMKLLREQVKQQNSMRAADAAADYGKLSERIATAYEKSPALQSAHIQDAQMRIAAMDKGAITRHADALMAGEATPRSEYELLAVAARLPKHDVTAEYHRRGDFASWTPEGQEAHRLMRSFAMAGDRIPYDAGDGSRIWAEVQDLYSPPRFTAEQVARNEMD